MKLENKIWTGLALSFLTLTFVTGLSYWSIGQLVDASVLVRHTHEVIEETDGVYIALEEAETGERGYIITGDSAYLPQYGTAKAAANECMKTLRILTKDNASQQQRIADLQPLVAELTKWFDEGNQQRRIAGLEAARRFVARGFASKAMRQVRLKIADIKSAELELLKHRQDVVAFRVWLSKFITGVICLVDMLLLGLGCWLLIRGLGMRRHSEERILKLNARLEAYTQRLQESNKALEAFSYSVSHDLRAPLRSIDGFSLALLEDYGNAFDAQGKDYLDRVRASTQRMGLLIEDLLNLSRVSRAELKYEEVDLTATARKVIAWLSSDEPDRRVEVSIQEGLHADGDPGLLNIALENLLGNAWKFTSKTPNARLEFGRCLIDGKQAYFVRDNGAGFDMANASKLFSPFQRLHSTQEFKGTGIGLATVERVIHRHGGKVWAEAAIGKGAAFYFTLASK